MLLTLKTARNLFRRHFKDDRGSFDYHDEFKVYVYTANHRFTSVTVVGQTCRKRVFAEMPPKENVERSKNGRFVSGKRQLKYAILSECMKSTNSRKTASIV